jgi:hypothetical protein
MFNVLSGGWLDAVAQWILLRQCPGGLQNVGHHDALAD